MDPCLNCCARRSSHRRSHSHHSRNGAPAVGSVVVEAMHGVVVVGRSCCVVLKKCLPLKIVSWEHLFRTIATTAWNFLTLVPRPHVSTIGVVHRYCQETTAR